MHEAAGAAILLCMVLLALGVRRTLPVATFGICWTAVALLPVSNVLLPTGILVAERALYLPSIGFMLAVGALVGAAWPRVVTAGRRPVLVAAGAVSMLCVAGVARSVERQRVWRDDETLVVRTAERDAPRSFRAQRQYGRALMYMGRPDEAIDAFQRAIALGPAGETYRIHNELGESLVALTRWEEGVEQFRASLRTVSMQQRTRASLVTALLALGRYDEASLEATEAIRLGGEEQSAFPVLRSLADSARRAGAPPGTVLVGIGDAHSDARIR